MIQVSKIMQKQYSINKLQPCNSSAMELLATISKNSLHKNLSYFV